MIALPPPDAGATTDRVAPRSGRRALRRPRRRCRSLRLFGDEAGGPAIEFALVTPILLLLLGGVVEFGLYGLVTLLLEGGLRDAARYGITGQNPTDGDRTTHMLQMIGKATGGLVDPADITFTVRAYPTFQDVGKDEAFTDSNGNGSHDPGESFKDCNGNGSRDNDRGSAGAGGSGQVVLYELEYEWPMWTTLLVPTIGADGKLPIRARAVVRNEPWDPDADPAESCDP